MAIRGDIKKMKRNRVNAKGWPFGSFGLLCALIHRQHKKSERVAIGCLSEFEQKAEHVRSCPKCQTGLEDIEGTVFKLKTA